MKVIEPATEAVLTEVPRAGLDEVDAAVARAREALPAWRALPPAERAALLHGLADALAGHREYLAEVREQVCEHCPQRVPGQPPFPTGTYGITSPDKRVAVIVSGTSKDFASYVLTEWPKAGWTMGRGESERNEAEDDFSKGNVRGHFWAQAKFCGHSEVLLQLTGS